MELVELFAPSEICGLDKALLPLPFCFLLQPRESISFREISVLHKLVPEPNSGKDRLVDSIPPLSAVVLINARDL